jgi:6-pyruvoyltetrahydropterin/6-carboxytetrahydropterin synthase
MYEVFKEFSFDAAHELGVNADPGHPYSHIHGHSFTACVYLRGEPDPKTQWLVDLGELKKALDKLHVQLDHRYLNEIEGLKVPTLENLCLWVWQRLKPSFPSLHRVTIKRGTLGEGCSYQEAG